jgi:hypothetical protein
MRSVVATDELDYRYLSLSWLIAAELEGNRLIRKDRYPIAIPDDIFDEPTRHVVI